MNRKTMVSAFCLLTAFACSKNQSGQADQPAAAEKTVSAATSQPRSAAQDFKQPYLSDDKITKFIASMKEENNPLDFIFVEEGGAVNLAKVKEKVDELNAFARKYGFADYEDYASVWGRITVAENMMAADQMKESTTKFLKNMAETAERELKKPDLSADMRKMYEEQLSSATKSLQEMQSQKNMPINAADYELVKARRAEIDEAVKKYRKAKG